MKPYSNDLREKIIQRYRKGDCSLRDLAEMFSVSLNFIWLLWQRFLATGSVEPKPHRGGRKSVMTEANLYDLRELVKQQNDSTLQELRDRFQEKTGISVSCGTISLALKKLRISRKKKTFHATERENNPEVEKEREEYIAKMPSMDTQHLVFIDEFGVNLGMAREYGRAPIGQRAEGHRPFNKGINVTVIGGLNSHELIAPLMFSGGMNGDLFKLFLEKVLVPQLKAGDVVLYDSLSSHKVNGVEEIIKASGAIPQRLPRYSPELSPFEPAVSKIKGILRGIAPRSYESLVNAVKEALGKVSPSDAQGWFEGCGYRIESGYSPL